METKKFLNLISFSELAKRGAQKSLATNKYVAVSILSLVVGYATLALFWTKLPPQIPLFYSKPWGESQLSKPYFLPIPLIIATVFLLLNIIIAGKIDNYPFLKKTLALGTTIVSVLGSIAIIRIILLVI